MLVNDKKVSAQDLLAVAVKDVDNVRKVSLMLDLEFKDTRMLPLADIIDYIGYRLNLSSGSSYLVKLAKVSVLKDTGIPVDNGDDAI